VRNLAAATASALVLCSALLLSGCTASDGPSPSAGASNGSSAPTAAVPTTRQPAPTITSTPLTPKNAEVQAHLAAAKAALASGSLPKDKADLDEYGFGSDGTYVTFYTVQQAGGQERFCITAGSNGGQLYTVTTNTDVQPRGLCPADPGQW
jgi:hypothetical protein